MNAVGQVPARMLNEASYCPRLFALEWMNGEWADSSDTVEGRTVHRHVDVEGGAPLPDPAGGADHPDRPRSTRSVLLGSDRLGIVARIDVVESEGGEVAPVDFKRGSPPDRPDGAWEPERVQVAAQAMLLREHGFHCERGFLWFAEARRRVEVALDAGIEARVVQLAAEARAIVEGGALPAPLVDSPKCPRCSLVGICLPDEHNHLVAGRPVRPLIPPRDDGVPLYVQMHGGTVGKDGDEVVVRDPKRGEVARARLAETSRLVVLGNATVTTPLMRELAERDVPVSFHSFGGWFAGMLSPASGHNVLTRIAQHRVAAEAGRSLDLARAFVHSKILNQRVLLRRNGERVPAVALDGMKDLAGQATTSLTADSLMGVEGAAARTYFEHFGSMLRGPMRGHFQFEGRNRRPPLDPVNALLSFAYACLVREIAQIAAGVGLDPFVGFLHRTRPGRPALALDLMEEFRPVLADSAVIGAVNNGVVGPGDFVVRPTGAALTDAGRRRFIETWERRLDELATHPTFETRLSYRRILEVQVRLLGKVLLGEIPTFPEYRVR